MAVTVSSLMTASRILAWCCCARYTLTRTRPRASSTSSFLRPCHLRRGLACRNRQSVTRSPIKSCRPSCAAASSMASDPKPTSDSSANSTKSSWALMLSNCSGVGVGPKGVTGFEDDEDSTMTPNSTVQISRRCHPWVTSLETDCQIVKNA